MQWKDAMFVSTHRDPERVRERKRKEDNNKEVTVVERRRGGLW